MSLTFATFGEMLRFLRRRARITQKDLSIAVGYSESYISRLEANERPPDPATLAALFAPALYLEKEPELMARLLALAVAAREATRPAGEKIERQAASAEPAAAPPNNLPHPLTSFVGRARELAELGRLAGQHRLITLIGSGGAGKSRLALRAAEERLPTLPDGAWLVELAPLTDPALIAKSAAHALGVHERPDVPLEAALAAFLQGRQLLIVLDNCEHLVAGAAALVERLLHLCPRLSILATSREILNVPGELVFRVPSLRLPGLGWTRTLERVAEAESVMLFADRAREALPSFALTEQNYAAVVQICGRLDGIPLAIELAAARLRHLSVDQIASRLDDRFGLLTAGSRTALPRHQTLRALVDWSYDLLSEPERILFARLSVFSGGWSLEAAEGVAGDPSLPPGQVFELLSQLVNKSLVVVDHPPGRPARYALLQTLREFAGGKLAEAGETEAVRARAFDFFLTAAQEGEATLFSPESSIDWAEAEIDNLRAALAWSLEPGTPDHPAVERAGRGLELMVCVWPLWLSRGYSSEGGEWMHQLLAAHTDPTPARARALLLAGDFARYRGDHASQLACFEESLALARQLGDEMRIGWALMEMGLAVRDQGRYAEAVSLQTDAVKRFRALQDRLWICRSSFLLAETHAALGNLAEARRLWEEGLKMSREADDTWQMSWGLEGLGNVERLEGRLPEARQLIAESLEIKAKNQDRVGIAFSLHAFAQLAAAEGHFRRAAVLWGAADGVLKTVHLQLHETQKSLYISLQAAAREGLGDQAFAAARAEGEAMAMEQGVAAALGEGC